MYERNPVAVRLRELQTLTEIARERNLVVVTPSAMGSDLGTILGIVRQRTGSRGRWRP
jgi:hypothetical protein